VPPGDALAMVPVRQPSTPTSADLQAWLDALLPPQATGEAPAPKQAPIVDRRPRPLPASPRRPSTSRRTSPAPQRRGPQLLISLSGHLRPARPSAPQRSRHVSPAPGAGRPASTGQASSIGSHEASLTSGTKVALHATSWADAAAAFLSLAATRMRSGSVAARATGLASSMLWATSSITGELSNVQHSKILTGANTLDLGAAITSAAAALATSSTVAGYASSAAWAACGAARILYALRDPMLNRTIRTLEGLSGTASLTAATLSAAATRASETGHSAQATRLAAASSAVWMVASLLELGVALKTRPDDILAAMRNTDIP
jgi:hypothetical protein